MRPAPRLRPPFALSLVLLALPAVSFAAPDFVEVPQFGSGNSTITLAWSDPDGDGDPDAGVGNTNEEQNYLYLNEGGGVFTELARFGLKSTFALVWGDVDNDGDEDMAVGNCLGFQPQNRLLLNNGDATFVGQNQFGLNRTTSMAWSDFDKDGDLDLAVGNGILGVAQQSYLYRNDGATFAEIPAFGISQAGSVIWGDFDKDGDPDLAVGNGGFGSNLQNFLYVNEGNGAFTPRAEFGLEDTACLAAGDYDNDGDLDVAVGNWRATQCRLYVNQGDGTFVGHDEFGARATNTCAWGDFDNDGDLDLAVGNGDFDSADQNYLYDNNGNGTFTELPRFGLGSTDALAWADFDGDGDIDVAAGNEHSPAVNYLYVNQENDSDALFLHLVGHRHDQGTGYSNRDGIGAKVSAYAAGHVGDPAQLLGFREIEAHGGFSAQNSVEGHFGLPGRSAVDLRIAWPGSGASAITQDVLGVAVPGRVVVDESAGETGAPVVSAIARWTIAPNPARQTVRIDLAGARGVPSAFDVVDASGRLAARISARDVGERTEGSWNLRDVGGERVAPGVYFVRLANGSANAGRIVVMR